MAVRTSSESPRQSGIRESHSWECLRCAAILCGVNDLRALQHHRACVYRELGEDPTRLALFAKLTPKSPA